MLVGEHGRQVVAGVRQPVGLKHVPAVGEPEGAGEIAQDAEIRSAEAHPRLRSKAWRAIGTIDRPLGDFRRVDQQLAITLLPFH
jgi:hypothetical protein